MESNPDQLESAAQTKQRPQEADSSITEGQLNLHDGPYRHMGVADNATQTSSRNEAQDKIPLSEPVYSIHGNSSISGSSDRPSPHASQQRTRESPTGSSLDKSKSTRSAGAISQKVIDGLNYVLSMGPSKEPVMEVPAPTPEEIQYLEELSTAIAQYEKKIEAKIGFNNELRLENQTISMEFKKQSQILDSKRKALNSSRSFTHREGTVDGQALIQMLEDLNGSIGDFAYEIVRNLHESAEQLILEPQHYQKVQQEIGGEELLLLLRHLEKMELTPMEVVDPIVRYVLCNDLVNVIFRPFRPGLSREINGQLTSLYQSMRGGQPQERCAHWRSISYTHAGLAGDSFLVPYAEFCIRKISRVVNILTDGMDTDVSSGYIRTTTRIFQNAALLQQKAKTEYLSYDYYIGFPAAGRSFNETSMKDSQGGKRAAKLVWLAIGLGMKAVKNAVKADGTIESVVTPAVKALAICDNWDLNAA